MHLDPRIHALAGLLAWRALLLGVACALGIAAFNAARATEASGDVLRVAMRVSPAAHLPYADFPLTLEDALVRRFALHLGARLEVQAVPSVEDAFSALGRDADMAAIGTPPDAALRARTLAGPAIVEIHPRVVYCAGNQRPARLGALEPPAVRVGDGAWHADLARASGLEPRTGLPKGLPSRLRELDRERSGYALSDQHEVLLLRRVLPCLRPVLGFAENANLRWWFADTERGRRLRDRAREFFRELRASGELDRIVEDHWAHIHDFEPGAAVTYMERIRQRLPTYLPMFREAAREHGLDWRLLAAVAYQESHWNPKAVSPTGVRGLMMLTRGTARQMALNDRHDPEKSLNAGAAYLLRVKDKLPRRIREPDRTWLALAAYNVGFGHLEDARILAQGAGRSPDRWLDVRPFLFRLNDKGCERLKRGCYRGGEGAIYVRRIRNFLEALVWLDVSGWLWEIPSLSHLRPRDRATPAAGRARDPA
jgi:membrane-bound lytic murein transglycosylase F